VANFEVSGAEPSGFANTVLVN